MKQFKLLLIGFLTGVAITAIGFYALVPRSTQTFTGKHKIKGDGNSMSYTVQQVEKMEEQWQQDCEEAVKEALKKRKRLFRNIK